MAKLLRPCTGIHGMLLLLSLITFSFVPVSRVQAQTASPPPQELIIHPYGVVGVKTLPTPEPRAPVPPQAVPYRVPDPEALQQYKQQMQSGSLQGPGAALPNVPRLAPGVLQSFIGLRKSESGNFIPPDTQVAAGLRHIFEVVNVEGRIFDKTGTPISTFSLHTFFGEPSSTFMFDPKIRFDPLSQRWFVAILAMDDPIFGIGSWRLAVSTSDDPTGAFVLYMFRPPGNIFRLAGNLPDFPALGINDDKVILTANAFNGSCDTCFFIGSQFVVFNKSQLVAGTSATTQFFPPDQGLFQIQPAHSLSSTTSLFMAAVDFGTATSIRIWSVTGVPGVGPGVTFTTTDRPIQPLSIPPDAVQLGTSRLIATNDNGLLDAVFRDGSLWVAANSACTPSRDFFFTRACLRFIQVRTDSLTVAQDFDFGTRQTYHYYPAIQTDSANNLITVFSRSSAAEFASVYASGQLTTDPPNTLLLPVLLHAGEAPYEPRLNRWGDYSGAGIDPVDQTTVWVAGEYARVEGGAEWGTWISQLTLTTTTGELTLGLNQPTFHTGNQLILNAQVIPGPTPVTADVYIALQPPGCTVGACLLFWQGGLNFTTTPLPLLRNWPISPFNGPIFSYIFGGTEPVGTYVWLGAFTVPGTENLLGEVTQVPFTFSP